MRKSTTAGAQGAGLSLGLRLSRGARFRFARQHHCSSASDPVNVRLADNEWQRVLAILPS
jgi:hypothetical protein